MPKPTGEHFQLNRDSQLADGLVFWLPLTSLYTTDRVRHLPLSPVNSPILAHDTERSSYQLALGNTQYFIATTTPITGFPVTINCWFNPGQLSGSRALVSLANSANATNFIFLRMNGNGGISARVGDGTTSVASTTVFPILSAWQMATGIFPSNSSRSSYLNATNKVTGSGTRNPTGINRIAIGADAGNSPASSYWTGSLGDIAIWNRALSDDEILSLYTDRWQLYAPIYKYYSFVPSNTLFTATLDGGIAPSGIDIKSVTKSISGSVIPSGIDLKTPSKNFAASVSPSGLVNKFISKLFSGNEIPSGTLVKIPAKLLSGILSSGGELIKQTQKSVSGSISPTAAIIKNISFLFLGLLSSSGTLTKSITKSYSGSINPTGTLTKLAAKVLDGGLTANGSYDRLRIVILILVGSLTTGGELIKQVNRNLFATVSSMGNLQKMPTKKIAGFILSSGGLHRQIKKVFDSILLTNGAVGFIATFRRTQTIFKGMSKSTFKRMR